LALQLQGDEASTWANEQISTRLQRVLLILMLRTFFDEIIKEKINRENDGGINGGG
jgi:hypothetical protein